MNNVNVIGNMTADPEIRHTPQGTAVGDFSIALNEKHKNSAGEVVEKVHFVNVTVWGKLAEVVGEHKQKGDRVAVSGRLNQDRWEKDGVTHSKLFVVADKVDFL